MQQSRKKKVKELADSILDRWTMFLVDVEIQGGKNAAVWVYVDSEDRDVGLDECAEVSQELGFLLEAHEVFDREYRLNVSTPGVDRPLVDRRQYRKNKGRKARITYRRNGDAKEQLQGRITNVSKEQVEIENNSGKTRVIEFENIVETVIVPEIK